MTAHQHQCPRCAKYYVCPAERVCLAGERAVCLDCRTAPPSEERPVPFGASAVR